MRFFYFVLKLVSVLARFAVAASPFLFLYFGGPDVDPKFVSDNHLYLLAPTWTAISLLVLFSRELLAGVQGRAAPVSAVGNPSAAEIDGGRHFDFMDPSTPEYQVFHYGGPLDRIHGDDPA